MNMIIEKGAPRPPIPEYTDEDFVIVRGINYPLSDWRKVDATGDYAVIRGRYWFRCIGDDYTMWRGPFDTLRESRAAFIKECSA